LTTRSSASSASSRLTLATAAACFALAGLLAVGVPGCKTEHQINTHNVVEIKPIYARIDVYLKIDKELDSFFDFEETIQPDVKPDANKKSDAGASQNRGA
jgi:hypothetical protein